jgi:hypothetical protein
MVPPPAVLAAVIAAMSAVGLQGTDPAAAA